MFKLALIGLDTSHSVEFSKRLQGHDLPDEQKIDGMKIISCYRMVSDFIDEEEANKRQAILESLNVKVTKDLASAVEGADGILIELNDPAVHLPFFEKIADFGLPVFLDKPFADTVENAEKIIEIAKEKNVRLWTCSALRFISSLAAAKKEIADPALCNVFGPLGKAAKGSDFIWYGIHTVEIMSTIMGSGAESVLAHKDSNGIVLTVQYTGNRRAVAQCNNDLYFYGGDLFSRDKHTTFEFGADPLMYTNLLKQMKSFFLEEKQPIELNDSLEIQKILNAAEKSIESGQSVSINL